MDIEIIHTHAEGTIATGTRKGDGSVEILKANDWRWSRRLGAWSIPRSRDQLAKTPIIRATEKALSAKGFEVSVTIDDTITRSVEAREADRSSRAQQRAQLLQDRADRRRAAADVAAEASWRISDGIPLGQPILVGHHSERRHRRDLERIQDLASRSVEDSRAADEAQGRAEQLVGATERRYTVPTVGKRIDRLEAELRKLNRQLDGYTRVIGGYKQVHAPATGDRAERLRRERADLKAQLDYWCEVREELVATKPTYSQETIKKGDYVRVSGHWRKVARVNLKSVSVETGYSWTDTAPYYGITEHRPGEEVDGPQP